MVQPWTGRLAALPEIDKFRHTAQRLLRGFPGCLDRMLRPLRFSHQVLQSHTLSGEPSLDRYRELKEIQCLSRTYLNGWFERRLSFVPRWGLWCQIEGYSFGVPHMLTL